MPKKYSQRAEDLRRALAQEAARIMAEHGIEDFLQAKRKAADRLGVAIGVETHDAFSASSVLAEPLALVEWEKRWHPKKSRSRRWLCHSTLGC